MKKCVSFVLSILLILSVFALPITAQAQTQAPLDISFREMDKANDLNRSGLTTGISSTRFTQGTGSLECTVEQSGSTGTMAIYIYRLGQSNNVVDLTGANRLTMDIWVPTDGYFDTIKGDAGVNIVNVDDAGNSWGNSAGNVPASNVKKGLKGLKAGWNFVVLPLKEASTCKTAMRMRFYLVNTGVAVGSKFYIDDVRLVNEAAVNTVVADRSAAKKVVGLLNDGEIAAAKTAYSNLLHRERVYVPADVLSNNNISVIAPTMQYTATFQMDGGTPAVASQTVYAGDTLRGVERPAKEGFAFGGWYVENEKVDLATYQMPAKNITITPKWVTPTTVSFDVNGGKTPIESQVLAAGETVSPVANPSKAGHKFLGWYVGDTLVDLETYVVPETDVTLTAKWEANTYYLKFNANGGYPANDYQAVKCGEKPNLPITPIKEGYVFEGWYNGMSKVDFATFVMPDRDTILNVKWVRGEEKVFQFGNVNGDEKVDAKDALELLKCSVKKVEFTVDQTCYGNVNADEKIDAKDALLVLQYAVQKIGAFPCVEILKNKQPLEPPTDEPSTPEVSQPDQPSTPEVSQPDVPSTPETSQPDVPSTPETSQPDVPQPVSFDAQIMTFNIRQSGANNELDGDNGWLKRKEKVIAYLNESGADVLCLQEVRKTQGEDITAGLSGTYAGVYKGRENITNPEGLMTIYNTQKYELVSQQLFWLSETPDKASLGWGARYYRICLVLTLKEKTTGKLLNVFNVHLDHEVEEARINGLKLVMERLEAKEGHSIVAGDFNTTSASGCYNIIADKMTNCQSAPGAQVFSTCQGFGAGQGSQTGSPIDFIFVDKENVTLKSYKICNDTFTDANGAVRNYSDHYAVKSTVTFTY